MMCLMSALFAMLLSHCIACFLFHSFNISLSLCIDLLNMIILFLVDLSKIAYKALLSWCDSQFTHITSNT